MLGVDNDGLSKRRPYALPVDGSPTGADESPALPNLQTRTEQRQGGFMSHSDCSKLPDTWPSVGLTFKLKND